MIFKSVVNNGCLLLGSDCQLAHLAIPIQSQLSERRSMDWYPITSVNVFLSLCPIFASFTLTFSNIFASCWTSLTAGAYSVVFLHSAWSKHPIASIGAQAIWIFLTWLFWIVGAGIVNTAASSFLLQRGKVPHETGWISGHRTSQTHLVKTPEYLFRDQISSRTTHRVIAYRYSWSKPERM